MLDGPLTGQDVREATEPTIVITFDDHGNMKLNSTPDVGLDKLVLAGWLLVRQANILANEPPPIPRIIPAHGRVDG